MNKAETNKVIGVRQRNRFRALLGAIGVSLLASLMLLFTSRVIDISRIHVSGLDGSLNDQVGYIGAARTLAETGSLHGTIVYPSTLWQNATKDYLYLPGHYVALAISYKLLGYGVLQSLLPNLLSYILASTCVFLSGYKLYSMRTGMIAALLFVLFPANVIYAVTAMSEMTRVAVSILALTVFLYLPAGCKVWSAPILLILPFLFRETGALLVIPMAFLLDNKTAPRRCLRTFAFLGVATLVLVFVYSSDLSSGRISLINADVFDPRFRTVYSDAVANQAVASKSIADWATTLPPKAIGNALAIASQIILHPQMSTLLEVSSVAIILTGMVCALLAGAWLREAIFISVGLMTGAALMLLLFLYTPDLLIDLRWLLFAFPFEAIVFARLYDLFGPTPEHSRLKRVDPALRMVLLLILIVTSAWTLSTSGQRMAANDKRDDQYAACLERLAPDPYKLLVAPYYMAHYVLQHYPISFALVPANPPSLTLLKNKYDVGMVIVRTKGGNSLNGSALTISDLKAAGLPLAGELKCGGNEAYLYFGKFTSK